MAVVRARRLCVVLVGAAGCWCALNFPAARAQDSVSLTPGESDALPAHGVQVRRYVVDSIEFESSWGGDFTLAPILKSSRDDKGPFNTRYIGGAVVSVESLSGILFTPQDFPFWSAPGQGVNPGANAPPAGLATVGAFDRQSTVALTDIGPDGTNVIGAVIGRRLTTPGRLFVTRVVAATSRPDLASPDTATLSVGSVDAHGFAMLRADSQGATDGALGLMLADNIVRVNLFARQSAVVNTLFGTGGVNAAADMIASAFIFNAAARSINAPSLIPSSKTGQGEPLATTLSFDGQFWAEGAPPTFAHLAPGVAAHRGNPSHSSFPGLGDPGGVLACLAESGAGGGIVDTINIFGVDELGGVQSAMAATLPSPLIDGPFSAAAPEFRDWGSQLPFRGPAGPVAIGAVAGGGAAMAAAAGVDSVAGEFIAVATFESPTPSWKVAARLDTPILNGPSGAQIARIVSGAQLSPPSPVGLSSPGMDLQGNVYFVAAIKPNLGPARKALIKAVHTPSGFRLERILEEGQIFTGANSVRQFQIVSLALADSDSLASGAFSAASVNQARPIGAMIDPLSPRAFGGCVVSATIEYDNNFVPERYDAALLVGPRLDAVLLGDLSGDGMVNSSDLAMLLGSWGDQNVPADLNGDGAVNSSDLALLLGNWT